jgi:hypothetical protein
LHRSADKHKKPPSRGFARLKVSKVSKVSLSFVEFRIHKNKNKKKLTDHGSPSDGRCFDMPFASPDDVQSAFADMASQWTHLRNSKSPWTRTPEEDSHCSDWLRAFRRSVMQHRVSVFENQIPIVFDGTRMPVVIVHAPLQSRFDVGDVLMGISLQRRGGGGEDEENAKKGPMKVSVHIGGRPVHELHVSMCGEATPILADHPLITSTVCCFDDVTLHCSERATCSLVCCFLPNCIRSYVRARTWGYDLCRAKGDTVAFHYGFGMAAPWRTEAEKAVIDRIDQMAPLLGPMHPNVQLMAERKRAWMHVILEELMAAAWHPARMMRWCMDEEERREAEGRV